MDLRWIVPGFGVLAALAGSVAASICFMGRGADHYRRAVRLGGAAFLLLGVGATVLLLKGFGSWSAAALSGDTDLRLRMLLVATFGALFLTVNAYRWNVSLKRSAAPPPDGRHPLVIMMGAGLLIVAWVGIDAFRQPGSVPLATSPPQSDAWIRLVLFALTTCVGGIGVVIGSAVTAHAAMGRREWAAIALPWARVGFLAAWMGVGIDVAFLPRFLGPLTNWGLLLCILFLVPLLHGLIYYRKKGLMPYLTPFFGALALPLAFLAATMDPWWFGSLLPPLNPVPLLLGLAPLAAWLARISRSRRGLAGVAARISLAVIGLATLVSIAWPQLVYRYGPKATSGWIVAVAALAVASASLRRRRGTSRLEARFIDRWFQMAPLVHLGMMMLASVLVFYFAASLVGWRWGAGTLAVLAYFVLPWPILVLMGIALGNQTVGRAAALILAAAAAATSGFLWFSPLQELYIVPAAALALLGAVLKVLRVSDSPEAPLSLRLAGWTLVVGSFAGIILWTNPNAVDALPFPLPVWAPGLGIALALVAMSGGISALRRRRPFVAMSGAFALAFGLPWALPVGLVLVLVVVANVARIEPPVSGEGGAGLAREFRKTGVYLIHVAVALLFLSTVASGLALGAGVLGAIGMVLVLANGGARLEWAEDRPINAAARTVK